MMKNRTHTLRSLLRPTLALALALASLPGTLAAQGSETPSEQEVPTRTIEVEILGMSCPFCAYGVEKKLEKLDGVETLEVELESGLATLTMNSGADISNEKIREVVTDAGFEVAAIRRDFTSRYSDWQARSD